MTIAYLAYGNTVVKIKGREGDVDEVIRKVNRTSNGGELMVLIEDLENKHVDIELL